MKMEREVKISFENTKLPDIPQQYMHNQNEYKEGNRLKNPVIEIELLDLMRDSPEKVPEIKKRVIEKEIKEIAFCKKKILNSNSGPLNIKTDTQFSSNGFKNCRS